MKSDFETLLAAYDYTLPPKAIAQEPASPRDSAQLLVYNRATGTTTYDTYLHIDQYLPQGALLVFNDTRVIPARLYGTTITGGKIEILFTHDYKNGEVCALLNKNLHAGAVITVTSTYTLTVKSRPGKEFVLVPSWPEEEHSHILSQYGHTPIPPYIKHSPLSEHELRKKYQTVFAKYDGSVAAPTASLHFTPRVLKKLKQKGFGIAFVTLRVNLGTFAPLTEEHVERGILHTEEYSVEKDAFAQIQKAKREGRAIIAVGTTAARTLETVARTGTLSGTTNLFIREGYTWKLVDGLITNFHVPRSSLLMLVATLVGREKLLSLYNDAIAHHCRFFSFGDGMLIR